MTRAFAVPFTGFSTSWLVNDSHLPLVAETSIFPAAIRLSMMVEWPMVPAMMTTSDGEGSAKAGPEKFDVPVVAYYSVSAKFAPPTGSP